MGDLSGILQELQIETSLITPEDMKILLSGIPVSESEDDLSDHSLVR